MEVLQFNLGKLLNGNMKENMPLENRDIVKIYDLKNMYRNQSVTIEGDVKKPGRYKMDENMNLNALIIDAGGFKDSAMTDNIEIGRKTEKSGILIKKSISVDYNTPAGRDFPLHSDDYIIIKSDPYSKLNTASVTITGEVKNPGSYNIYSGGKN